MGSPPKKYTGRASLVTLYINLVVKHCTRALLKPILTARKQRTRRTGCLSYYREAECERIFLPTRFHYLFYHRLKYGCHAEVHLHPLLTETRHPQDWACFHVYCRPRIRMVAQSYPLRLNSIKTVRQIIIYSASRAFWL